MTVYIVQHGTSQIQFKTLAYANEYATLYNLGIPVQIEVEINVEQELRRALKRNQENAAQILEDFYIQNTLEGITLAQSDVMFDDYQDVILRIKEGAFTTALYRLQQKVPSGFVTQAILVRWITTLENYIA